MVRVFGPLFLFARLFARFACCAPGCRQEVNLPGHIVKDIEAGLGQPSKKLFVAAQSVIWRLINADTFPKFLQSPEYKMVMCHLLSRAPVKRQEQC